MMEISIFFVVGKIIDLFFFSVQKKYRLSCGSFVDKKLSIIDKGRAFIWGLVLVLVWVFHLRLSFNSCINHIKREVHSRHLIFHSCKRERLCTHPQLTTVWCLASSPHKPLSLNPLNIFCCYIS